MNILYKIHLIYFFASGYKFICVFPQIKTLQYKAFLEASATLTWDKLQQLAEDYASAMSTVYHQLPRHHNPLGERDVSFLEAEGLVSTELVLLQN